MFDSKKTQSENVSVNGNNRIIVGTKIKGEIISSSDFRIDGEVEGTIITTGRLVVGKGGVIKGRVECANADVEGNIQGNIIVKGTISLKSTANIQGDVITQKISIEPGAIFNVKCQMGEQTPQTQKIENSK